MELQWNYHHLNCAFESMIDNMTIPSEKKLSHLSVISTIVTKLI